MKTISQLAVLITTIISVITPIKSGEVEASSLNTGIIVHYRGDYADPYIHYWDAVPNTVTSTTWPGDKLVKDSDSDWYTKGFAG